MVDINMTEIIKRLLRELTAEDVLYEIGIPEHDQTRDGIMLACPCPIHHDTINKTLKIDLRNNHYKCDWHQCSGSRGGDFLDLYCKAKPCTLREGIDFWTKKLSLIPSSQETLVSVEESNEQLLAKVFQDMAN